MDKFLQSNTVVKGVAFLLACMLWMIVSLDDRSQSPVPQQDGELSIDNVRVELLYDEELFAVEEWEETVQVVLSGRRALLNLNMLRADPYRIFADLTGLGAGQHRVPLQYDGFPTELRVEIIPRTIQVVLEEKEIQPFDVVIEPTGQAKDGFMVGNPLLNPQQVHVIAPPSVLERIALVKGFIPLAGADHTVSRVVQLKVYDHEGNEVRAEISPNRVEVSVPVFSPSVSIPVKLQVNGEAPDGVSIVDIEAVHNQVKVFAPLRVLDQLSEIEVPIDLSTIHASQTVSYTLPVDPNWTGVEPQVVEIRVEVAPTVKRTYRSPLQIKGLGEGLALQTILQNQGIVEIDVWGSEANLNKLQELPVTIDVTGLPIGIHRVPLQFSLPEYLSVSPGGRTIQVDIHQDPQASTEPSTGSQDDN